MAVLLIAEDDEDVRMVLQRLFRRAGYTVLTAPDGASALPMTVAQHPDVVLTDLDMPGLSGLELAQALREHPGEHDVPIMILSGSLHPGDPRSAQAQLCGVMLKPFINIDLVATVRHLTKTGRHRHDRDTTTCPLRHRQTRQDTTDPLRAALARFAETPQDTADLDAKLTAIAQLAADRVTAVDYASVTALRAGAYSTVAANSAIARAVDDAQYADLGGPCVQAVNDGTAVVVPDIAATMAWPGFRDAALTMGLHASVSVPLIAGSGTPVAVLNLYSRDTRTMAALIAAVWTLYHPDRRLPTDDRLPPLDPGGEELIAGLTAAINLHRTQQAQ